jgi:hypothetical protein
MEKWECPCLDKFWEWRNEQFWGNAKLGGMADYGENYEGNMIYYHKMIDHSCELSKYWVYFWVWNINIGGWTWAIFSFLNAIESI